MALQFKSPYACDLFCLNCLGLSVFQTSREYGALAADECSAFAAVEYCAPAAGEFGFPSGGDSCW